MRFTSSWPLARRRTSGRTQRGLAAITVAIAATTLAAALGVAAPAASATSSQHHKGSGPVDVLYAGSLVTLMQTSIGRAFHRATGYSLTGIAAGSTALAAEIEGGVRQADVFVSASPKPDRKLERASNGKWVSWYLTFATSPLLLGYNRSSRFAKTLETKPWWKVVAEHGFLLGRTNPVTDPKGVLAVKALDKTARKHHDAALRALGKEATDVFPEQTMVGRLQAGQLDAGFFYGVEAAAAKIPTVPLKGVGAKASYTITVLARAPHPTAADAFVAFMLSSRAEKLMKRNGLTDLTPPKLAG